MNHGSIIADDETRSLTRGMNSKSLHLTIADPPASLPPALEAMGAELDGDSLRITFAPDSATAGAILAEVGRHGLEVVDVSTEEANLQSVFLELTR